MADKRAGPPFVAPMLATLTDRHFSDPGWIYERKLDGVRAVAVRGPDGVRLYSRNQKSITGTYPELVEALGARAPRDMVADGEIVAFDGDRALRRRFDELGDDVPSFAGRVRERGAHWLRPELVAQIGFTEWTGDGRLRHPRYLGLRDDKPADQVVREEAAR